MSFYPIFEGKSTAKFLPVFSANLPSHQKIKPPATSDRGTEESISSKEGKRKRYRISVEDKSEQSVSRL